MGCLTCSLLPDNAANLIVLWNKNWLLNIEYLESLIKVNSWSYSATCLQIFFATLRNTAWFLLILCCARLLLSCLQQLCDLFVFLIFPLFHSHLAAYPLACVCVGGCAFFWCGTLAPWWLSCTAVIHHLITMQYFLQASLPVLPGVHVMSAWQNSNVDLCLRIRFFPQLFFFFSLLTLGFLCLRSFFLLWLLYILRSDCSNPACSLFIPVTDHIGFSHHPLHSPSDKST